MSAAVPRHIPARASPGRLRRLALRITRLQASAAVPVGLFAIALAARAWAVALVTFPMTEGSTYYVAVARNLVAGRGLVIDALWSYSTPPLVLPRPAFELWQPMASLIAAVPMSLLGPQFSAAQMGGVILGSALAPLAWLGARDIAQRLDLPPARAAFVALDAGLLAAVAGPFLLSTAVPDSTLPFTVMGVAACCLMKRAADGDRRTAIVLGVLLGLLYLTRLEAIYFGLTLILFVAVRRPGWRTALHVLVPVLTAGAVVVFPWWVRNLAVFGTPFPGQAADNLWLTRNEQIFAYVDGPSLGTFLAQGVAGIATNVVVGIWHNLFEVMLVPAAPMVAVGLVTLGVALTRHRLLRLFQGSLGALLVSGVLTLAATSVLFPVATLWGTFEHAAGPLLVGLAIVAAVGVDAFIAWVGRLRGWHRANAWLGPLVLAVTTMALAFFQLVSAARLASDTATTMAELRHSLSPALAALTTTEPIITDRPLWLSDALGRPTLALPDEPIATVLKLGSDFHARLVVVFGQRGLYPAGLDDAVPGGCVERIAVGGTSAQIYKINSECVP